MIYLCLDCGYEMEVENNTNEKIHVICPDCGHDMVEVFIVHECIKGM